jgi:hypothetical protein
LRILQTFILLDCQVTMRVMVDASLFFHRNHTLKLGSLLGHSKWYW